MTLRIVSDNTDNIVELDVQNWRDVPGQARLFATDVESGIYGEVNKVIVIVDTPDGLHLVSWGESMSQFEAVGMLEVAKLTDINSIIECDDD